MRNKKKWKYTGYLKKGISHEISRLECQDSIAFYDDQQVLILALSDGLGSLKYSEIAAKTATKTTCDFLRQHVNEYIFDARQFDTLTLKKDFVITIKQEIEKEAGNRNIPISQMDCTLVFACIHKASNKMVLGRLGDSAICVIKIPPNQSVCFNDGNVSANGTSTVLEDDSYQNLELHFLDADQEKIAGLILTSDGLENELYMKNSNHVNQIASYYINAVSHSSKPEAQINQRICKLLENPKTPFDDDISVAVASCIETEIELPLDPTWLCRCGERNRLQDTYCKKCRSDFSKVYRNVVFKEYGGKASFFEWINQHPEKEWEIIKGEKEEVPVREVEQPKQRVTQRGNEQMKISPNTNIKRKRQKALMPVLSLIFLFIGVLIGVLGANSMMARQIETLNIRVKNLSASIEELQNSIDTIENKQSQIETESSMQTDDYQYQMNEQEESNEMNDSMMEYSNNYNGKE